MSLFDHAWAAASAACDATFGETVRFNAKKSAAGDVNSRRSSDPTRASFDATGIYNAAADARRAEGRGMTSTNVHRVVSPRPTLVVSGALLWIPRVGDTVQRTSLVPAKTYEIVEVHRHEGGIVFEITEAGSS